jgi:AcrR family transcriptional regulator
MVRRARCPLRRGDEPPNRRERARAATILEIKQTAFALMRETGSTDVRFADIARSMGLTAPALYRYFADRDELLTALVVDSYDDLGAAVAAARDAVAADDLGARLLVSAAAYRRWAASNPERFALIFGLSVPGYAAPPDGPTSDAAKRAMGNLQGLVVEAMAQGRLARPLVTEVGGALEACVAARTAEAGLSIPSDTYQAMLHIWTALHGFTCLEVYGHLGLLLPEARDELFLAQVRATALAAGLPAPLPADAVAERR